MLTSILLSVLLAVLPTFKNPILYSDYSDPDVIEYEGEFWMTASSFCSVPGLQILHSYDLVNWEIVNAAIPSLGFSTPEHGNAVWAPSIRVHDGVFHIFWGDPDRGIFVVKADDPAGKWSEPELIIEGKGLIDPCPLWDEDGRIYLVHGWAGSRAGFKSILSVCELDESLHCICEQVMVFDGKSTGNPTVEGPKFYKRNGYYYIFAPAGGVKTGWQLVLRSKNIYGPYEYRTVMEEGNSGIHGPHQGGLVEDAEGKSWFIHFEDRYAWGRVCHLQPVSWDSDYWCVIGVDNDGNGIGEPVLEYSAPKAFISKDIYFERSVSALETRTNFNYPYIPLSWQKEADLAPGQIMTSPSDGSIRMFCVKTPENYRNLWDCSSLLLEKIVGPKMEFVSKMVFRPSFENDETGLVVFGRSYSAVSLQYTGGKVDISRKTCIGANKGESEVSTNKTTVELDPDGRITVWIKMIAKESNSEEKMTCQFLYSLDGKKYKVLGEDFNASAGEWIGAKVGFYTRAEVKKNDSGSVDIY